jgi:hypothetical protein
MKKIKVLKVITGKYTDKNGAEKKRYTTVGSLFEDGGNFKIKLDSIPLSEGGWSGWINCYDLEEKETPKTHKSGFDDMDQNIPF